MWCENITGNKVNNEAHCRWSSVTPDRLPGLQSLHTHLLYLSKRVSFLSPRLRLGIAENLVKLFPNAYWFRSSA